MKADVFPVITSLHPIKRKIYSITRRCVLTFFGVRVGFERWGGKEGEGKECFSPHPPSLFFLFKVPTDDVKRRKPLDTGISLRLQGTRLGR